MESFELHRTSHLFSPFRMKLARELRALGKGELAERIQKTPGAISQFESGRARPDSETVLRLAVALGVPPQFFQRGEGVESTIAIEDCHFRSLRSATQRERRKLLAIGTLLSDLIKVLEHYVDLPIVEMPDLHLTNRATVIDIEQCAEMVRKSWGLGSGPINNLVSLVESRGAIVCPLKSECEKVDAFSYWHNKRPYIFMLLNKECPSRSRFDIAHELGHLVMHTDVSPGNPEHERQANRFASAFLLPQPSFLHECPTRLNWAHLLELKVRWGVSLAALVRRGYDLGRLSEASYRRACIHLNRQVGREPNEPERERPFVIGEAVRLVLEDQALPRIAEQARITEVDIRDILELLQYGHVQPRLF